jgi:hypothetical protein
MMAITDAPQPSRQHDKLCCCPPVCELWGSTYVTPLALGNKMEEDEALQVRADANASVKPPGGPDTDADGSGGSELKTRLRKDVDVVVLVTKYRFEWRVQAQCRPVQITLDVDGTVHFHGECLPDSDAVELSFVEALEYAELRTRQPRPARASLAVTDCAGKSCGCTIALSA